MLSVEGFRGVQNGLHGRVRHTWSVSTELYGPPWCCTISPAYLTLLGFGICYFDHFNVVFSFFIRLL